MSKRSSLTFYLLIATTTLIPALSIAATATTDAKAPAKEIVIAEDNVYIPDSVYIKQNDKKFTFDWNNDLTIAANKDKVPDIEIFVNKIKDLGALSKQDKQIFASLLYKLGTYYTHVSREPDQAISKLGLADLLLTNKQAKAWNYNHLAYAYEQKYAASQNPKDKEKALFYVSKVTTELYPNKKNKEVAFALCIQGLVQKNTQNFDEATASLMQSLHMYEDMAEGKDDQYVRVENGLANVLLNQNGKAQEALALLEKIQQYWLNKADITNDPYAARSFLSLAKAYLIVGNALAARDQINQAINIYQHVYGNDSKRLMQPYQLLGMAYKKLGDNKQSLAYEHKAGELVKQATQTNAN